LVAGLVIAAVQVLLLALAVVLWRQSPGTWGSTLWAIYFTVIVIVGPIVGWWLAGCVVGRRARVLDSWPVGFVSLLVVLFGHGFEEGGLPFWAPFLTIGSLCFLFGAPWFFERGLGQPR
jgi:hypothetical protein